VAAVRRASSSPPTGCSLRSRVSLAALGFLGAGVFDHSAYQTAPTNFDYLDRDDLVTQTMAAFTSTTANCARCHAHKFDPDHAGRLLRAAIGLCGRSSRATFPLMKITKVAAAAETLAVAAHGGEGAGQGRVARGRK